VSRRLLPYWPHVEAIKRAEVLSPALRVPEVANLPLVKGKRNAVVWLSDELNVEFHEHSQLVRISLRGQDPDQLAKVLDSVAATYSRLQRRWPLE
jgi:hypothetical protein